MLAAARYGHVEVLREVINKYGCDKNAVKEVRVMLSHGSHVTSHLIDRQLFIAILCHFHA